MIGHNILTVMEHCLMSNTSLAETFCISYIAKALADCLSQHMHLALLCRLKS